jgi:hypothetical protein
LQPNLDPVALAPAPAHHEAVDVAPDAIGLKIAKGPLGLKGLSFVSFLFFSSALFSFRPGKT